MPCASGNPVTSRSRPLGIEEIAAPVAPAGGLESADIAAFAAAFWNTAYSPAPGPSFAPQVDPVMRTKTPLSIAAASGGNAAPPPAAIVAMSILISTAYSAQET